MRFTRSAVIALAMAVVAALAPPAAAGGRERLSLDTGWLFHRGEVASPPIKGHGMSYQNGKANGSWGAAAADFDDSGWRRLDLPHDWAVEGAFAADENPSQGYRPRGIGWYRRYLKLPESDRGRDIELQFDAIATYSTVWINGIVVNRNWSGYNGRHVDITPYLRYGDDVNTIAVRVDADAMEGWWYEGAGIYRHAWLVKRDALHIATDGLHANPVKKGGRWWLPVEVTLESSAKAARDAVVDVTLLDPTGAEVAKGRLRARVGALESAAARMDLEVRRPLAWSLRQPRVYRVRAVLREGLHELDRAEVQTGFRTIRFDADQGFFLNDEPVKLHGVCIHQDHAGVGGAVPESIWEFRLRRLKEMGVNAIRFSHNAPAAEVLDMADRMGLLVMDENRHFNPSPDYLQQLTWLVRRDRNHPSVILWSIFNEEPLQGTEVGYEMARRMAAAIRKLDATRPVTAAMPVVSAAEPATPLLSWRVSPAFAQRPDPNVVLADNDMNSWGWDEPPIKRGPEAGAFRLYRCDVNVRADRNDGRAQLAFGRIAGRAEVWVDGVKLGEKTSAEPAPLYLPLPVGAARRQLTVLVEAQPGQPSGLLGRLALEPRL